MSRFVFQLPDIGEGIAEAEIVNWHVKLGDSVQEDDKLVDMMTGKATVEIESPVSGVVVEVAGDAGDVVAIGAMLVVIDTQHAGHEDAVVTVPAAPESAPLTDISAAPLQTIAEAQTDKVLASPAVRARARTLGVDLAQVRATTGGRIRHADLDAYMRYHAGYALPETRRGDEQVRVIGMRRRIAEAMSASKRNIPHFSYVEECYVTDLEAMRAQMNDHRGARPKLTLLPFIITALSRALPEFPALNAHYDDEAGLVTRFGALHLGLAVQTPAGLMVPVIRDAQAQTLWRLATEIQRLSDACRDSSIGHQELTGATFTLTSLGALGGVATTPVINRPEVAILGPNRIIERPMFVADSMGGERIEKRKLMNLSISCDHRVVDGWDAARFVQALRQLLEAPARLLM